jgi:methionyl-tRNA formyltransferase
MASPFSTGIFISGGGSFAEYAKKHPELSDIEISIIADRETVRHPESVDIWLLKKEKPDYWERFLELALRFDLVFINFNWIIPPHICGRLWGRMINHHPALLPAFRGLNIEQAILRSGVRISGSTFHFVTEELDNGPIIAQTFFPVKPDDTPQSLGLKNWSASKDAYVQVIRWFANGRVELTADNRVRVIGASYSIRNPCIPAIDFKTAADSTPFN